MMDALLDVTGDDNSLSSLLEPTSELVSLYEQ